jgi:hypothetical protein
MKNISIFAWQSPRNFTIFGKTKRKQEPNKYKYNGASTQKYQDLAAICKALCAT